MSWMFGLIKKTNKSYTNLISNNTIHPKPNSIFRNNRFYIAAGGSNDMCSTNLNDNKKIKFIVLGLGIKNIDHKFSFVDQQDWYNILKDENSDLTEINGHFVTLVINNDKIIIRNDQLGLRDLFYLETDDFFCFSTRLDWLTKVYDNSEINFESFSSFWNLMNNFSKQNLVKGIERLNAGGQIIIDANNDLQKISRDWHPSFAANISGYSCVQMLKDLTLFPINDNSKINLALSGGIDSRTLLSLLLSTDKTNWQTITWGQQNFPDAIIANRLADHYKFQHDTLYNKFDDIDDIINNLYDYISETYATLPAYTMKELGYYRKIDAHSIFIDGGSGALMRRVIGNKILFKGRKYILDNNVEKVYSIFRYEKADIFNEDTRKIIKQFSLQSIETMLSEMPDINVIGNDNWVDLLNVRYFKSFNGSIAQSRIDNNLKNYMPYTQPSLLKLVFNLNNKIRKSSAINREILKEHEYLTKCPIVKYETIIPFTLNLYTAYITAKIFRKIKKYPEPNMEIELLDVLSEFVQDRMNSNFVKHHPYYNYNKLKIMSDEYYKGNKQYASQLNWWLSYDIWREIISQKSVL